MPFRYQSGEEIRKGDRITYAGAPGEVEFVADRESGTPETDWYITEFGGGAAIITEKFGRVFIDETDSAEDLVFVSRG